MTARWLLDLTVGGRVYRYATEACEVDGDRYETGLGALTASPDAASVSVTVDAAPRDGWAGLALEWPLEGVPARVRWQRGDEAPVVVIDGYLTDPSWGTPTEGLTGQVTLAELSDGALMPDPTHVLAAETWPLNRPPEREGQYYPVVFGRPGAVPIVLANNPTPPLAIWVVADGQVAATTVDMVEVSSLFQGEPGIPCSLSADSAGAAVTIVSEADCAIVGAAASTSSEYFASWRDSEGGTLRPDRSGALVGAGEVMRYALTRWSTLAIDDARWRTHEQWMDQYLVDTYVDEPTDVWAWVQGAVLPMLPARVRRSSTGLWVQPMRWDATSRDVTAHLQAGRNVTREGRLQLRGPPVNAFSCSFAREYGKYRATRVLTGESGKLVRGPAQPDSRVIGDYRCALSQSRWGIRWSEPIELAHTWAPETALRVLRDRALEQAIPHRTARYVGGMELGRLEPGAVVAIVDDEVAVDGVALVEDVTWSVDEVALSLVVLDGPRG
jgi:hypothetical protein